MSASSLIVIILVAVVVVIVVGYIFKVNYGLLGICAAFVCGVLLAGLSPRDVIGMWSVRLFFQMFSIMLFYAYALNNGTLELLARKLVYATRKARFLTPVILFVLCGVIAGIGPGTIATFLIITPIVMQVAKETGMKPALAAIVLSTGVNFGGWSPLCTNGITLRGIIEESGYEATMASGYELLVFRNMLVASALFFIIAYVIFKGWNCGVSTGSQRASEFNREQKTTLILIVIFTCCVVIPPICNGFIGGDFFSWLANVCDPTFLAIIFAVIATLCRVGDEKKAILSVPWKTIIMVCGMGMLIAVASEVGATDYLAGVVSSSFSATVLPYIMALVAAGMSLFSSTMGVVIPTLYPLIFTICAASGASPVILFSVVPLAATSAGNSPFSLQGGLVQSAMDNDRERNKMFFTLIIIACVQTAFILALIALHVVAG